MCCVIKMIYSYTVSSTDYKHLYLKDDQWVVVGKMVKILKALQMATTEFCEAKVVAMSHWFTLLLMVSLKRI